MLLSFSWDVCYYAIFTLRYAILLFMLLMEGVLICYFCYFHFFLRGVLFCFSFSWEVCCYAINAIFTLGRCAILLVLLFSLCHERCAIFLLGIFYFVLRGALFINALILFSFCLGRCAMMLLMLFSLVLRGGLCCY